MLLRLPMVLLLLLLLLLLVAIAVSRPLRARGSGHQRPRPGPTGVSANSCLKLESVFMDRNGSPRWKNRSRLRTSHTQVDASRQRLMMSPENASLPPHIKVASDGTRQHQQQHQQQQQQPQQQQQQLQHSTEQSRLLVLMQY